jgi:hypothetical protein
VFYKAFAEFFAVRMTLATFVAHTFAALRALALPGFAVVSFNALAIFFAIAVTLVTLTTHVLAALCALFAITFLDFRDAALSGRGNSWRLESRRWRRRQRECRQGKG